MNSKFSLKDALDYLEELIEEDESPLNVGALYIEPPEIEQCDSGEDDTPDNEASGLPDNVCPGQLNAGCEIAFTNGERIDGDRVCETVEVDVIDEQTLSFEELVEIAPEPGTSTATSLPNKIARRSVTPRLPRKKPALKTPKINLQQSFHWTVDDSLAMNPVFPHPNYSDCNNLKPHEQFEKFFDEEILQHICDCSNLYAKHNNKKIEPVNIDGACVLLYVLCL